MKRERSVLVAVCLVAVGLPACGGSVIRFVNSSNAPIAELYLAAVGERNWGPNYLGREPLVPGDSYAIGRIECDHFDVRLVDIDGTECILENELICMERSDFILTEEDIVNCQLRTSGGETAVADSTVTFTNASPHPVVRLHLANVGERSWGPNHLGGQPLGAGESHTITDVECGFFDVLLVDPDGSECILENVDVCNEDTQFIFTNDDLLACQGR